MNRCNWRDLVFLPGEIKASDLGRHEWRLVAPPAKRTPRESEIPPPLERRETDYATLCEEWTGYVQALAAGCGSRVLCESTESAFADQWFVGDHLRSFGPLIVQGRMKSILRQREAAEHEAALRKLVPRESWRRAADYDERAVLEHGDEVVLRSKRLVLVGVSGRTNERGVRVLDRILAEVGWRVTPVPFDSSAITHLNSAAVEIGEEAVLLNPQYVDADWFTAQGVEVLEVDPAEPRGAASLWLRHRGHSTVLMPHECPRTAEKLERRGFATILCPLGQALDCYGTPAAMCAVFHSPVV